MPSLYVTEPGATLATEAGRLVVAKGDDVLLSVPANRVSQVVIVGNAGVTTPALTLLLDRKTPLVFLTTGGAFRGRLAGDLSRNMAVRRQQYARSDDERFCLEVGRALVAGKIRNCRTLCLRWDTSNADAVALAAAGELRDCLSRTSAALTRESLMGIEGQAAKAYFRAFRRFLHPGWSFPRRTRRPPADPVNAVLSLLYTLLHETCFGALETASLDPWCGFFHQPRYGRASLAVDMMEEFRPLIADSVALTLLNNRMVQPDDFRAAEDGGVFLTPDALRVVAAQYNRRLRTPIRLPNAQRRTTYHKLLEVQARHLRAVIQGDRAGYEPFLTK